VLLTQDIQDLLTRLSALPSSAPATLADDLALLALTSRVYGGQLSGSSGGAGSLDSDSPLQIQISGAGPLTDGTVADQRQMAEDLLASLEARKISLDNDIAALEPEILALQGEVAEVTLEGQRLESARNVAAEVYFSRAIQVNEADLAVRQAANVAQVASPASVPFAPDGPARTIYVLLGAALGAALGVGLALAREFLRPAAARVESKPVPARVGARTP
jgi:hypothetical protein